MYVENVLTGLYYCYTVMLYFSEMYANVFPLAFLGLELDGLNIKAI